MAATKIVEKPRKVYLNEINLCKAFEGSRLLNVQDRNDVLVIEISK